MKTNYPDRVTIQQYLEGKLDSGLMHQLEKQAQEDPFLWEALEGYTNTSDASRDLSILQRQLHERIVHLQENKKVFDLTWQRLSVAAAAAVLFIAAGILFWMNSYKPNAETASNQKQVEVMLADPDSLNLLTSTPALVDSATLVDGNIVNADIITSKEVTLTNPASPTDQKAIIRAKATATESAVHNPVVAGVQPLIGWELYRQYLELNMRKPKNEPILNGIVVVSLQVDRNGKLANFKIRKGLTEAYNAEAIRLIKEGPEWRGANDGKTKELSVEVIF